MELVAGMLLDHLQRDHTPECDARPIRPRFFGFFEGIPGVNRSIAFNADRVVTRFLTYPAQIARQRRNFELFHVSDHSYAHLVHLLPARRTGVYCHDLDAFSPIYERAQTYPRVRLAMARAQLSGLKRAAVVFYSTEQIRRKIEERGLVDSTRLVHAPYGVGPEFFGEGREEELPKGTLPSGPFLLNVGNNLQRKRLDVLFRVFAALRQKRPGLNLVQQGAQLTAPQRTLVGELGIGPALIQPPFLSRAALAALYHRAELVLLTSEREGFGLPVLEALAGGAAVVASDIPAFREVAGDAISFCPVGEVDRWVAEVNRLLDHPDQRPDHAERQRVAARYTWTAHAAIIANAYSRLSREGGARA